MSLPRASEWIDPGSIDVPPRRGRRIIVGLALLTIAALGSIAVWHGSSLRRLPDIGEPFDTRALGTIALAPEENAFTYYRLAVAKLQGVRPTSKPLLAWGDVTAEDKEWFFANSEAIELWVEGTLRDRALDNQPRDFRLETPTVVVSDLGTFAVLAQMAGLRMEAVGDLDAAWPWYRAGLRSSRHCGMNGGFVERLIGIAIYTRFDAAIRGWADGPNLTTDALRQALDEVIAINGLTPTFAENLRAEYFVLGAPLADPSDSAWSYINRELATSDLPPSPFARLRQASWRFVLREPERSRRLLNLVFANWLSVGSLTDSERAGRTTRGKYGPYYDPPPGAPASASRLTMTQRDAWIDSTLYLKYLLPTVEGFEKAEARELALRAGLVVRLAEELYRRDHGTLPARAEDLVGPYLKAIPEGYAPPVPTPRPEDKPR